MNKALPLALALMVASIGTAAADDFLQSSTRLSAAQEVQDPAVESDGRARGVVFFDGAFERAVVRLGFEDLVGGQVTRLHLHCNKAGENGPIAIGLIDTVDPNNDNSDVISFEGNVIFGELTNAQFPDVDPCPDTIGHPVNNIVSLAAAIDAGLISCTLHPAAFPAGALGGPGRPWPPAH